MGELAPIAVFAYKRLDHLKATIDALAADPLSGKSVLYVFCDGPKNEADRPAVLAVKQFVRGINGFSQVHIIEQEKNLGLAASIISGVTRVAHAHGRVIVVEDDLVVSPAFLTFMNKALDHYQVDRRVFCVTGYNFPDFSKYLPSGYAPEIYFIQRPCSWGWATWKDRWDKAVWDMDHYRQEIKRPEFRRQCLKIGDDIWLMIQQQVKGRIDSWAVRWDISCVLNGGYCLYPLNSMVRNIGFDGSGVHTGSKDSQMYGSNLPLTDHLMKLVDFSPALDLSDAAKRMFKFSVLRKTKLLVKKLAGL